MKTKELMKNKMIIALGTAAFVCMAAFPTTTHAQKFGYVNSAEILYQMPEIADVQKQLEDYSKELDTEYQTMVADYQKKEKEYQEHAEKKDISETMLKLKYDELVEMAQRLQKTEEAFQLDLQEKQEKLMLPLAQKIENVIKEIAKEKGLNYVFDTSKGALLYAEESDNITQLVKDKLGIKTPPPGTNDQK